MKKSIHINDYSKDDHLIGILESNGYRIIDCIENDHEVLKIELKSVISDRLRKALGGMVQAIAMAAELRDPYTAGHQIRVSDLARRIASEMGIKNGEGMLEGIRIAASIHDIGKLGIPSDILSKPATTGLSKAEFDLIKMHPQKGYDILKEIDFPWPIAEIVYQHHERINGSGYPRGLKSDDILVEARIIAVADVVEAMASHRPYRPALGLDKAVEEIQKGKGKLYDKEVVKTFLKLYKKGDIVL
jgi:HD-GYP domain-containing protein (c-di-GMP phosphodiesterase class II)